MPLGVELAASWTRVMSCDQIAAQIERDLGFLETTTRNVPERHRSIPVLFDHSFGMLTPAEQDVLMRLSVFRGTFTLESAERVADATPVILRSLVEKSLIRSDGADHYDMHQLLQRYAHEKLDSSRQAETARDAHAEYFAQYAEAHTKQSGADAIEACYDDMRAALSWADERRNALILLRMGGALRRFWETRGYHSEARMWLARALELDDGTAPLEVRAEAIFVAGTAETADFVPAREFWNGAPCYSTRWRTPVTSPIP
jgi:predicted ATPase